MVNNVVRQWLEDSASEDSAIFDCPAFDNSIVGVSTDFNVIYSLPKMIVEYMNDNNCSEEDAIDFISYNTLRSVGYFTEGIAPVVLGVVIEGIEENED